jgi:hypothetical protein
MNEKPESEEFDDDEPEELTEVEDVDVDKVIRDLDVSKKRGQKAGDPAWRKLERMREERATREMIKDFDDYDIGAEGPGGRPRPARHA